MKNLLKILYALYLIFFVDILQETPMLNMFTAYSLVFPLILIILLVLKKEIKIKKNDILLKIYIAILCLYGFGFLQSNTNTIVLLRILALGTSIFLMSVFIKKYPDLLYSIIKISFWISSIFILYCFYCNGVTFEAYQHLSNILFSTNRFRLSFGMYHVNAAGNIALCSILVSFLYINANIKKINKVKYKFIYILIVLVDFISFTVLLSTNSRSSILALFIFFLVQLYFKVINIKNKKTSFFIKIFIIVVALLLFGSTIFENAYDLFTVSNRLKNFTINLPLLNTLYKWIFGLGVISPGSFGTNLTGLGSTYFVDNYFLYILLTRGLVGVIATITILFILFNEINKLEKNKLDIDNNILVGILASMIFTSFGETCLFYYIHPSCFIYWCIICGYISINRKRTIGNI